MTGPASPTGAIGIAAMMALMPLGVSFETLMLGGLCFFGGCCCRTGIILYKKLNGIDPVTIQFFMRQIAALLCCIPLAAVASGIVFLGAHVLNVKADAGCGGILLILGVRGPEGFQWLADTAGNIFMKFAPGAKPGGGPP